MHFGVVLEKIQDVLLSLLGIKECWIWGLDMEVLG